MPLNPQVEALLAAMAGFPPVDYEKVTAEALRMVSDRPVTIAPPPGVARCETMSVQLPGRTIEVRLYIPFTSSGEPLPLTLYFHGGGWVIGTLETHDATCRALAAASGSALLSVAYRLAPEYPFPAGLNDCHDVLAWAAGHASALGVDARRLAVAGDSAGGNLAAAVALMARDAGGPALRHQLLLYPVTDRDFSRNSYVAHGAGGAFLSTAAMKWFWNAYLAGSPSSDFSLAAIYEAKDLSGLPPATVITAEYDPLCDEGMAYAARLVDAGVPAEAAIAPGMIHGFISLFQAVPDARPWIERSGQRLKEALA